MPNYNKYDRFSRVDVSRIHGDQCHKGPLSVLQFVFSLTIFLLMFSWSTHGHAQSDEFPGSSVRLVGDFSFWEVLTDSTSAGDRSFQIVNDGFESVEVIPESASPDSLSILGGTCSASALTTLPPQGSCTFTAHFDEQADTGQTLNLQLTLRSFESGCFDEFSDSGECFAAESPQPSVTARMDGFEVTQNYTISARERSLALLSIENTTDFNGIAVGVVSQQSVTLTNTPSKGSMLNLDATAITVGDFLTADFRVVGHDCAVLEAEQSCTLDIEFAPGSDNEFSDRLPVSYFSGSSTETVDINVSGTGAVVLNDSGPGVVSMRESAVTVNESAQQVTLSVDREAGADGSAQVLVQFIDGTAVSNEDYVITVTQLSWSAGNSDTKTITIPI